MLIKIFSSNLYMLTFCLLCTYMNILLSPPSLFIFFFLNKKKQHVEKAKHFHYGATDLLLVCVLDIFIASISLMQDALFQAYALQNQYGIPHSEV